jgi:uncharacterized small protein (DUF1192 family)
LHDEIERLECQLAISRGKHTNAIAEIERLEVHKEQCFDRMRAMQDEIERLRAENEKLKECIAEWQKDSALNGRW